MVPADLVSRMQVRLATGSTVLVVDTDDGTGEKLGATCLAFSHTGLNSNGPVAFNRIAPLPWLCMGTAV